MSCRKDSVPEITHIDYCQEIPPYSQPGFGYNYQYDDSNVTQPCYNPENSNEICFLRDAPGSNSDLIVHDLISEESTLIYSGIIQSPVKWGYNDWLIFGTNGNIYRIKSNGDSLSMITNSNNCFYPIWSEAFDYFYCAFHIEIGSPPNQITQVYTGKFDVSGNIIDTIEQRLHQRSAINNNGLIISTEPNYSSYQTFAFDANTGARTNIETSADGNQAFKWVNNYEFLTIKVNGITKTNIINGEKTVIKNTCNSEFITEVDYNPLNQKILCSKVSQKLVDNSTILYKERLVIMDLNGENEVEVSVP